MWYLSLIFAGLVELLFLMHHADPDYMGIPLELYKILRVTAVLASAAGAFAFWRARKQPDRNARAQALMLLFALLPTLHWIVGNGYFRSTILLAQGSVAPPVLVAHLEDHDGVEPKRAAAWLLKPGKGVRDVPRFTVRQLSSFLSIAPRKLERYVPAMLAEADARIARLDAPEALRSYRYLLRYIPTSPNPKHRERLILRYASERAMRRLLPTLDQARIAALPLGLRALLTDLKSRGNLTWPIPVKIELTDSFATSKNEGHGPLYDRLWRCRLVGSLEAAGLQISPTTTNAVLRIVVHRSGEARKTTFVRRSGGSWRSGESWPDMTVPLYTLDFRVLRSSDGRQIYRRTTHTNRDRLRSVLSSTHTKERFQSELYDNAMWDVCDPLIAEFDTAPLFPLAERRDTAAKH